MKYLGVQILVKRSDALCGLENIDIQVGRMITPIEGQTSQSPLTGVRPKEHKAKVELAWFCESAPPLMRTNKMKKNLFDETLDIGILELRWRKSSDPKLEMHVRSQPVLLTNFTLHGAEEPRRSQAKTVEQLQPYHVFC